MIPPLETNSGGLAKDMTLRDWFAAQAMTAIIAKLPFQELPAHAWSPYEKTAIGAYDYARHMMIERERGE